MEEKAIIDQWAEVESHKFNELIVSLVFQLEVLPGMGQPTNHELVKENVKKLENVLDVYEKRLSESKYLGGDNFSIADMCHLPGLTFLITDGYGVGEGLGDLIRERKFVNSWWNDISSRPSWNKVMNLIKTCPSPTPTPSN